MRIPLANLLVKSPLPRIGELMKAVQACADKLPLLVEAVIAEDSAGLDRLAKETSILEGKADEVKNAVRAELPTRLLLPVDRRDLLRLVSEVDAIAPFQPSAPSRRRLRRRSVASTSEAGLGEELRRDYTPSIKPIRTLLQKTVLPDPGEGPSREERERGFFVVRLIGKTAGGDEVRGRVEGQNDPGYGETAKMLGESALCLARDDIAAPGGIRTPASTMGLTLIERLREAGMVFRTGA